MQLPSELIGRFRLHLSETREEVAALRLRLAAGGDGDAVEQLRAVAHRLAGTAGAFGHPGLGDRAHRLEAAIKTDPGWDARLENLLAGFDAALGETSSEPEV